MRKKTFLIPAILSALMIGAGQIMKGHSRRALKWILFFYFFYPVLTYTSLNIHSYVFLAMVAGAVVIYPLFWLYNIRDAYTREI
jgi:hypothetical protein